MKKGRPNLRTLLGVLVLTAVVAAGVVFGILYGAAAGNTQAAANDVTAGSATVVVPEAANGQTQIILQQDGSTVSGTGASVSGNTVTISEGGSYVISGTLEDGQIYVAAGDDETVVLILSGVDITNADDAAIYVENADETILQLAAGTTNRVQSGQTVDITEAEEDSTAEGAAIYASDDLSITGTGILQVYGYINNGIHTKNDLLIDSGNIEVEAVNNGIKGKDSVTISGGSFTILSGGDAIKSDDTTGEGYGVITISGGSFDIESMGDAVQAETALTITDGTFSILTGEGSEDVTFSSDNGFGMFGSGWDMSAEDTVSAKGLKCAGDISITGGSFSIDSYDDAIHSNGTISISGGNFSLASGDDGIHADTALNITGGTVLITKSYEGLEANQITIDDGTIAITASDDGINANGGESGFGFGMQQSSGSSEETPNLIINGGTLSINAGGDGLDSNGNILVTGGVVTVDGPSDSGNASIDYGSESGGTCIINGGTVLALGSSGMVESISTSSEQYSFVYYLSSSFQSGSKITISDSDGNVLYEHTAAKTGDCVIFSSPELAQGETYILTVGGESMEVTLSSISTTAGSSGNGGFGGQGGLENGDAEGFGGRGGLEDEDMGGFGGGEAPEDGDMGDFEGGELPEGMEGFGGGEMPEDGGAGGFGGRGGGRGQ